MIAAYFVGGPLDLTKRQMQEVDARAVVTVAYQMAWSEETPHEKKMIEATVPIAVYTRRRLFGGALGDILLYVFDRYQ
jgi:hypothetical protein